MSHPPIIVISVPGGKRHNLADAHLGALGLASLLSPAVFVQTAAEEVPGYDHSRRLQELGYGLTKGEIGCFLAHQSAWGQVVRLGQTSLILEDDARLDHRLIPLLTPTADAIADQAMLVRFYSVKHPRYKTWRALPGGFELVRPLSSGGSTVAYLITPESARKLLAGSQRFWLAVDEYMDDEASHGCVILHGFPEWVAHDDEGASMVGARVKPRLNLGRKVFREWKRAVRNARQYIHREKLLWRLGLRF